MNDGGAGYSEVLPVVDADDEPIAIIGGAIAVDASTVLLGSDHISDAVSDDDVILLDETEIGCDAYELEEDFVEDEGAARREEDDELKAHLLAIIAGPDDTLSVLLSEGDTVDLAAIHVFKKLEEVPARIIPLAEVTEQIRDLMIQRDMEVRIPEYGDRLRAEAHVKLLPGAPQPFQP
jgi:hypothetical protein